MRHLPSRWVYENRLIGTALRDQVAAVLRDADAIPVAPKVICEGLGEYRLWLIDCGHPDICDNPSHRRDLGLRKYQSIDIRPALKSLERMGLVEHHAPDPRVGRPHYWRWIGPEEVEIAGS